MVEQMVEPGTVPGGAGGIEYRYMGGKRPSAGQILFAGKRRECVERYYLGTPGCGKSTALIAEVNRYCLREPGSVWLLARYTETEAASVLKGDFERETPREVLERWDHEERRWYYRNGSSVYVHGLKAGEGQAPFSKIAGYNLSGVAISQVEALPDPEWIGKLRERLRHQNPPRLLLAEGNVDVSRGHWLFRLVDASRPVIERRLYVSGPRLIVIGNLADNERNLPPEYGEGLRRDYPPGHPQHGPKVSGWFGPGDSGEPVYGPGVFKPEVHVGPVEFDPRFPLLEAWDFGIARPAVLWSQFLPGPRWVCLGEWMGNNVPLGAAVMEAKRLVGQWFPGAKQIFRTADPAGAARKDVGPSSVQFLRGMGLGVMVKKGANTPVQRLWAIQQARDLLTRRTPAGEAVRINPRCEIVIEGLQYGYKRDPARVDGMPVKDGYFDHIANCLEYTFLAFWGSEAPVEGSVKAWALDDREPGEPKDLVPATQTGY